jgi:UDP-glucose 4-epimerase
MNILLTGGAGYIGSHTAVVLNQYGHKVVLLDNFCNSDKSVLPKLQQITGSLLDCVEGDVRDTKLLIHTIANFGVESVIHFAGLKAVSESVAFPLQYYDNNVQGAISLLQAMQETRVKTLAFSSSATVYGDPKYLPIDEAHPTSATNAYGRSKLHIEEMLADVVNSDPAWRIACLRYFNPVGAHESGLIGENPQGVPDNLMPLIAQVAAGQRDSLNVFGDDYPTPDGTAMRDYIHVMDLAEGHRAALQFLNVQTGWHSFNLGTGEARSVLQMMRAFESVSGKKIPHTKVGRRAGDVAVSYANSEKALKKLGWHTKHGLDQMCTSAWKFQANCRIHNPQ